MIRGLKKEKPMNATDHYKAGRLQEAVDAQIQLVKAAPAEQSKRLFLFELLAFTGDLDRARRQIEAIQYAEPEKQMGIMGYRKLLEAEEFRRKVFTDGIMPHFLVPPPGHLGKRLEAINALRNHQPAEASRLLAEADQECPPIRGMLNGKPFLSLRDCDDLFGPTLEVMAHGDYYWLPLDQVDSLGLNAPKYPRDLVWMPAKLAVREGPAGDVFLPALYPNSHQHADNQIKLGRTNDWTPPELGPVRGVGTRTFFVGDDPDPMPLLDWRELQMA